jgi:hypothetical protein
VDKGKTPSNARRDSDMENSSDPVPPPLEIAN